jgi:anthranilate synthase component 1
MTTLVQFEQLKSLGYNTIPVYRQRLADTETPFLFLRASKNTNKHICLSLLKVGRTGRVIP